MNQPHVLRGRRLTIIATAAVAVMIALHLGLGGLALIHWGWSIGAVAAMVFAKVLVVVGYRVRRRVLGRGA